MILDNNLIQDSGKLKLKSIEKKNIISNPNNEIDNNINTENSKRINNNDNKRYEPFQNNNKKNLNNSMNQQRPSQSNVMNFLVNSNFFSGRNNKRELTTVSGAPSIVM